MKRIKIKILFILCGLTAVLGSVFGVIGRFDIFNLFVILGLFSILISFLLMKKIAEEAIKSFRFTRQDKRDMNLILIGLLLAIGANFFINSLFAVVELYSTPEKSWWVFIVSGFGLLVIYKFISKISK